MRDHRSSDSGSSPLLGKQGGHKRERDEEDKWWKYVLEWNMEEAKNQVLFSLPMIVTNGSYYLILLISVMFAGHLGQLQLAGSTLANSWSFVTGFSFMVGISGALETLCGQGFGAQVYHLLGIYLQATCMISFLCSLIISIIWWYTESILNFLHQSPEISKQAAIYMIYLIPGLFAYGVIQNILRFLQTQSVVTPLMVCSFVPLFFHIGLNYVLVFYTSLGYKGAPLAASISFWLSVIMLLIYVNYTNKFERTWRGLSIESLHYFFSTLKLALPSAAMVCLEYWAFEILVLLAGLMPNSETTTSVIAMCVNTSAISFNFVYGLSAAASTRVANELGARRPDEAKKATLVTLKLTVCLAIIILLVLGFGHDIWASFFSDEIDIIQTFASMTPLLCISIFLDSMQGILTGVSRGCGWQHSVMYINMGVYYLIGLPISSLLAFAFNLYVKGLWIGIICGLLSQNTALFLLTFRQKWTILELPDNSVVV